MHPTNRYLGLLPSTAALIHLTTHISVPVSALTTDVLITFQCWMDLIFLVSPGHKVLALMASRSVSEGIAFTAYCERVHDGLRVVVGDVRHGALDGDPLLLVQQGHHVADPADELPARNGRHLKQRAGT